MSEVSGKVVFRTHDVELVAKINALSDDVTWEELHALLQAAEVDDLEEDEDDEEDDSDEEEDYDNVFNQSAYYTHLEISAFLKNIAGKIALKQ